MRDEFLRRLSTLGEPWPQAVINILDVLLVAYLIWRLLKLVRGTRAWRILFGVFVFLVALLASDVLGLRTLHWVLDKATLLGPVALVILFLPELRQTIEGFARMGGLSDRLVGSEGAARGTTFEEIAVAARAMAQGRTGALIVIDRSRQLDAEIRSGVPLHAVVSAPLLQSIFYAGNPLHDGAIIVRQDELVAAACQLPLSDNPAIRAEYHMRHRAGVGVTEHSDAVVVIVSEERGEITVARAGILTPVNSAEELLEILSAGQTADAEASRRRAFRRAKRTEANEEGDA
ncbi:MAG TPA: diadenylate cyclase CdaA [Fimbriimonadaceae bacterium]|nr:TIGR00159 family protein [Armatimonadota bacterium]HCM74453.1 TIGR00159 family protein [Armatimonadota bacterium]HRD30382.1 diadenylate cyclase CdaA [Fimbriimonadaceae bacterium]HRE92959.1 diadenylate cyclase CdaA [Fimbriimonadaceae bacterium]HRI74964.1 diadenylate cyclase CdaA [Fimbriimonadaceae bacterium]